jgi:tetratricopeptide (TPR) repeat protein
LFQSVTLPQADQLYAQGNFPQAAQAYKQLLESEPRNALLLAKLGASEYAMGEAASAAKHLAAALEINPNMLPAQLALGGALLDLGQPEKAIGHLKRAQAQAPRHLETQRMLGRAYQEANRFFDGERTLRAVVKQDPEDWRSWTYLGILLYNNNYYAAALDALRTALKLQPENPRARMLEASSLAHLGQYDSAQSTFETLLNDVRLSSDPELLLGYTQFLVESGKAERALQPVEKAIQAAPNEAKLHFWRARVLMLNNQLEPAAEAARRAIDLAPEQPNARNLLLRIARKLGRDAEVAAQARWLDDYERNRKPVKQ